jgi:FlaA1/EpsC-like NDP-sugar epimerase
MTQDDAVNLIVSAAEIARGGEVFVLKMPLIRLKDLFEEMKYLLAPKYGFKSSQIKTKIIGMKPGEKLVEELLNDFEMEHVLETKDFFIIPPRLDLTTKKNYPGARKLENIKSFMKNMKPLEKEQVLEMLKKIY